MAMTSTGFLDILYINFIINQKLNEFIRVINCIICLINIISTTAEFRLFRTVDNQFLYFLFNYFNFFIYNFIFVHVCYKLFTFEWFI